MSWIGFEGCGDDVHRASRRLGVLSHREWSACSGRADEPPKEQEEPPRFIDRFKAEPVRPKANEPIRFLDSYEQAKAEARATNRRILLYFTGPGCAWCRVLESRTFTDAEVVDLSRRFVCVELRTDRDTKLADEFQIDSIPRSILLMPDGAMLDQRVGYLAAADYAIMAQGGNGQVSRAWKRSVPRSGYPRPRLARRKPGPI